MLISILIGVAHYVIIREKKRCKLVVMFKVRFVNHAHICKSLSIILKKTL
jgi:hypothetical protein